MDLEFADVFECAVFPPFFFLLIAPFLFFQEFA